MTAGRGWLRGLLLGVVLTAAPAGAQAPEALFWRDVPIPPLRPLEVPTPEVYTLPNGLRVLLLEDRSLPKVEATLLVRTGEIWEPADKLGVAAITGRVMRSGGTTTRSGDVINELLEAQGASVETVIERDRASASMFALAEDFELALGVLADVVRNPAFPEDEIALAKVQEHTAIARRNDQVDEIARREFRTVLFGADSPYGRHPEHATVDAVTRADVVAFHRQAFWPGNAILGVVGDFDVGRAKALVERELGGWQGSGERLAMPAVGQRHQAAVFVVDKPDVAQTQFRFGHVAGRRDAADYFALEVWSEIFGGGTFSSRLVKEVRTRLGLAYSVFGYWLAEYERDGVFLVVGGTKNESTAQALRACLDELRQGLEQPPTEEELSLAKESILNAFVFRFDTRAKIVAQLMEYAYHGYPLDYLQRYREGIAAVTAEDVQQAARRNVRPDRLVFLVAGDADAFRQAVAGLGLGPIETVDVAIPPQAASPPGAAAGGDEGGGG